MGGTPDDYLVKHFNLTVLPARLRAHLRQPAIEGTTKI
jgi:DNA-binding response OmpR family regulator